MAALPVAVCLALPGLVHGGTEFHADGSITSGENQVVLRPNGSVDFVDGEGREYGIFLLMTYPGHKGMLNPAKLKDAKLSVDENAKSATFSAVAEPPGGPPIPIRNTMTLRDDGHVRVKLEVGLKGPFEKYLSLGSRLHVTRDVVVGGTITVGDKVFPIAAAPPQTKNTPLGSTRRKPLIFNDGVPERRLAILPVSDMVLIGRDNNTVSYRPPFVEAILEMKGNVMEYDLELPKVVEKPKSADTHAGVDFWAADRLHMPPYGLSRNLVQNPGFEAGFPYWRLNTFGAMSGVPGLDEYYAISTDNPQSGLRCLALRGEPGQSPAQVATFAIPVEKGRDYTLSYFARAEKPGANLGVSGQGYWSAAGRVLGATRKLTTEWQRFSHTFKAPNSVLSIGFGNQNPSEAGTVFVDSVQLEKGSKPTEFTTRPILAWVQTAFRGNLWQPGVDPHAAVELSGAPGAQGEVRISQTDFFGKETDRGTHPFTLDAQGRATLALPWAGELPLGLYVLTLETRLSDGFAAKDFGRLTVMDFLENTHRHKDIFSSPFSWRYPEWKRDLEFYKRVGIGSSMLHDPGPHHFHEIMEQNGILHFSSIFDGGGEIRALGWNMHDKKFDFTDEQLAKVEELAFQRAKAYPEVHYWKFFNEPPVSEFLAHPELFPKMHKVIAAAKKGALRANPGAKFVGSDPSNMFASSGMAFVDKDLATVDDGSRFDIAAIHPYRARPEEPDRDKDTATFLGMLDRHGFAGDVWFTEGIYHQNYVIPQWELNTHQGCSSDHYRAGAVSYAMGWGEHMAAAYAARSWLVSLKYGERVKMDVDWGFWNNSRLDLDNTPCALAFASNTLGHVLGNATFRKELNLGYEVRCYVFENEKSEPVAAIWYANLDCDKGRIPGPKLDVSALNAALPGMHYLDFMGNTHALGDTLELSPFPVFLTGPDGRLADFVGKLGEAALVGGGGQLHAWLELRDSQHVDVVVENTRNRAVQGTFRLQRGSKEIASGELSIDGLGKWTHAFAETLEPNSLNHTDVTLEIIPNGGESERFDLRKSWMLWPRRSGELSQDGSLKGWENAFHAPLVSKVEYPRLNSKKEESPEEIRNCAWKGEADLSATLYATWDAENLYLAIKVQDGDLHPAERFSEAWKGDSVQLYFDGWANAARQRRQDYDGDDQSFQVWPHPPEATIFRDVAPERQLAFLDQGVVQDAKSSAIRLPDGSLVYHVTLPLRDIQPVKLEALQKFGFAALVNDNDGDFRKRALTLTPEGTEPYRHPAAYPTVILVP